MIGKKNIQAEALGIKQRDNKLIGKYYFQVCCYLHTRNMHDKLPVEIIEDLIQRTWLIVLYSIDNDLFNFKSNIGTYIIGIAKNQRTKIIAEEKKYVPFSDTGRENILDNSDNLNTEIKENKKRIFDTELNNMDEICRDVLIELRGGASYKEIYENTEFKSIEYLKTKIKRCKDKLRNLILHNKNYDNLLNNE